VRLQPSTELGPAALAPSVDENAPACLL
jgi:hypothetical protein